MTTGKRSVNPREQREMTRAIPGGPSEGGWLMSATRSMGNRTGRPRARIALGIATVVGAAGGTVGVLGAGTAVAHPVSLTLRYTCLSPAPLFASDQPITVSIDSDIPSSLAVGAPSPKFVINTVTTGTATLTRIARLFGVRTIEGTSDANTTVVAPQGNIDVTVHLVIPRTTLPASGPAEVEATGTTPTRTFSQPGNGRITVGDLILHLDPKNASGKSLLPTPATVSCKVDAEQNKVLALFDITATRTTTASTPSGTTGTTTSGTPRPTISGTAGFPTDGTPSSTTSGTPGATALTNSTANSTATGMTTTGGQGTRDLTLLAVGALVAGALVAGAAAFFFGSRLKNHRRAADDG